MDTPTIANTDKMIALLKSRFGDKLIENQALSEYTTFKIGGPARLFINCRDQSDLVDAVNLARAENYKYFILGGGSNLLVSDQGFAGLIIHVATQSLRVADGYIMVAAGHDWEKYVDYCCANGLAGVENMAGIKGSVGGAIYGNAGAFGCSISDILLEAEILRPGGSPRWEKNNYFAFSYRNSILKRTKEVILRAKLKYEKSAPEKLISKKDEILALRDQRHPENNCSAGCFFKNIEKADEPFGKLAAGKLLEQVGAKDMQVGGAKVFPKHANILINSGTASAEDVRKLAEILKKRVKDEYGYVLEEEITFLGD